MLFSLISPAITLLAASAGWLSHGLGDSPVYSGSAPTSVTPQDPSTFTLALIGAGTIVVFLAARWRPSRGDGARWTGRLSDQSTTRDAAEGSAERRQSRGAA